MPRVEDREGIGVTSRLLQQRFVVTASSRGRIIKTYFGAPYVL